ELENLAIIGEHQLRTFERHGLLSVGNADDRQAPMPPANARRRPDATGVRPAMGNGIGHAAQKRLPLPRGKFSAAISSNPTHRSSASPFHFGILQDASPD